MCCSIVYIFSKRDKKIQQTSTITVVLAVVVTARVAGGGWPRASQAEPPQVRGRLAVVLPSGRQEELPGSLQPGFPAERLGAAADQRAILKNVSV